MTPQFAVRCNPTHPHTVTLMKGIWTKASHTRMAAAVGTTLTSSASALAPASRPFSSSSSKMKMTKASGLSLPFRPRRRAPAPLLSPPISTSPRHSAKHPPTPISEFETGNEDKLTLSENDNPNKPNSPTNQSPTMLRYLRRAQSRLPSTTSLASPTTPTTPRLTAPTLVPSAESLLRAADYFTSEPGSTEDRVLTRRAVNVDAWSPEDGRRMLDRMEAAIAEERRNTWMEDDEGFEREHPPGHRRFPGVDAAVAAENERYRAGMTDGDDDFMEIDDDYDPNQRAYGPWSESVVAVDRVQKVMRGGTTVRYRALAIGGNLNGCAGYGIAKAHSPPEAVAAACRKTRRNIFFVDRYKGHGITEDLVGKHNSLRVTIRAAKVDRGLKGNALGCEILKYFGITDCTVKSHGNRNNYNVVYAMFKALMCHESLEEIALKRGKRLLNVERAKRLQI